jgi:hypothetical protein
MCDASALPHSVFGRQGILKMDWGKTRVRLAPAKGNGYVPIDYWGDFGQANLVLILVFGICSRLPESISEAELVKLFPEQNDKDPGPAFWKAISEASQTVA